MHSTPHCGVLGRLPLYSILTRDLSKHLLIKVYSYTVISLLGAIHHRVWNSSRKQFSEIPSQMISFIVLIDGAWKIVKDTGTLLGLDLVSNIDPARQIYPMTRTSPRLRFAGCHLTLSVSKAGVVLANTALPVWASGIILLRNNIILVLWASLEVGFLSLHNPLIHSFTLSYYFSFSHLSFIFIQTFPHLEGTLSSATVLAQIASSNTSLASASPLNLFPDWLDYFSEV